MPEIATQSCAADVATSTPSSPVNQSNTTHQESSSEQPMKRVVLADRYKTKLCDKWLEKGKCPYDRKCMFAHGEHELRTYEMNLMDDLTTEENIRQFRRNQRMEYQRAYYENYCLPDMMQTMSLPPQYYQGAPPPGMTGVESQQQQQYAAPPAFPNVEQASVLAPPAPKSSTPIADKSKKTKKSTSTSSSSSTPIIPAPRSAGGKNSSMTSDPSAHHETGSRTGTVEYNSNCGESEHDGMEYGEQQQQYAGEHFYRQSQQQQQQQQYYGQDQYHYYPDQWYQQQQQQQYASQDGVYYYYPESYQQAGPYRSTGYQQQQQQQQTPQAPTALGQSPSSLNGSAVQSEMDDGEATPPVHKRAGSRASSTGSGVYRYNPYGAAAVDSKYLSHKRGSQLRDPTSAHP